MHRKHNKDVFKWLQTGASFACRRNYLTETGVICEQAVGNVWLEPPLIVSVLCGGSEDVGSKNRKRAQ